MSVREDTLRFLNEEETVEVYRVEHGRWGGPYSMRSVELSKLDNVHSDLSDFEREHGERLRSFEYYMRLFSENLPGRKQEFPELGTQSGWLCGFASLYQARVWFSNVKAIYDEKLKRYNKGTGRYGGITLDEIKACLADNFGWATYHASPLWVKQGKYQVIFKESAATLVRRLPLPKDLWP